jgi:hypothetical protein
LLIRSLTVRELVVGEHIKTLPEAGPRAPQIHSVGLGWETDLGHVQF